MKTIRVIVADDHTMIRSGLKALLDREPDIEVVAEAADGRQAVQKAEELLPEVVLLDIAMPNLNGIDTIREFRTLAPGMKLIAMSGLMSSSEGNTAPDFLGMAINLAGIPKLSKIIRVASDRLSV